MDACPAVNVARERWCVCVWVVSLELQIQPNDDEFADGFHEFLIYLRQVIGNNLLLGVTTIFTVHFLHFPETFLFHFIPICPGVFAQSGCFDALLLLGWELHQIYHIKSLN